MTGANITKPKKGAMQNHPFLSGSDGVKASQSLLEHPKAISDQEDNLETLNAAMSLSEASRA